ncbi:hypothetical protein SNEBB_008900 [Seison nebaliae]|nr:hypothetical protein SNEBB_008900 [Seison nebaliae]
MFAILRRFRYQYIGLFVLFLVFITLNRRHKNLLHLAQYGESSLSRKIIRSNHISARLHTFDSVVHCFDKYIWETKEELCLYQTVLVSKSSKPFRQKKYYCSIHISELSATFVTTANVVVIKERPSLSRGIYSLECYVKSLNFKNISALDVRLLSTSFNSKDSKLLLLATDNNLTVRWYRSPKEVFIYDTCYCSAPIMLFDETDVDDLYSHIFYYFHYNVSLIVLQFHDEDDKHINEIKSFISTNMNSHQIFVIRRIYLGKLRKHIDPDKLIMFNSCFHRYKYQCKSFISHDPDEIIIPSEAMRTPNFSFNYWDFVVDTFRKTGYRQRKADRGYCAYFDANVLLDERDTNSVIYALNSWFSSSIKLPYINAKLGGCCNTRFRVMDTNNIRKYEDTCRHHYTNVLNLTARSTEMRQKLTYRGRRYVRPLAFEMAFDEFQRKYFCLTPLLRGLGTHDGIGQNLHTSFDDYIKLKLQFEKYISDNTYSVTVPTQHGLVLHHRIYLKEHILDVIASMPVYPCKSLYYNRANSILETFWNNVTTDNR